MEIKSVFQFFFFTLMFLLLLIFDKSNKIIQRIKMLQTAALFGLRQSGTIVMFRNENR